MFYILSDLQSVVNTFLKSILATQKGLEPSTSGVTGRHSNQLSHWATLDYVVVATGIEPVTPCL